MSDIPPILFQPVDPTIFQVTSPRNGTPRSAYRTVRGTPKSTVLTSVVPILFIIYELWVITYAFCMLSSNSTQRTARAVHVLHALRIATAVIGCVHLFFVVMMLTFGYKQKIKSWEFLLNLIAFVLWVIVLCILLVLFEG